MSFFNESPSLQVTNLTSQLAEKMNKGEYVLNVKDFKCSDGQYVKGDGIHDDSTGIQACLDYARDNNISTVMLGKGVFLCNIILDSHMTLMGTGEKTILKLPNNAATHCVTFRDNTTKFVTIRDLTIDGNKSNQTTALSGLYLYSSDRGMYYDSSYYGLGDAYIRIDNVKVLNCKGDGIYLYIRGESIYTNIHSLNNDGNGIWGDVFDAFFTNISCGQNTKNGFRLYSNNNRFYNIKGWNNGIGNTAKTDGRGIYLTGADNHVNGEFQGNLLEGVSVYDTKNSIFNVNVDTSGQRDSIVTTGVSAVKLVNSVNNIINFTCKNRPDRNETWINYAIQLDDNSLRNKVKGTYESVANPISISEIVMLKNEISLSGTDTSSNVVNTLDSIGATTITSFVIFTNLPKGKTISIGTSVFNSTLLPEVLGSGIVTISNGYQGGRVNAYYSGTAGDGSVVMYCGVYNNSTSTMVWRKITP